ncbi:carbon starvation protein A [candidate division KSB1 bacterium]|nr:carbon starvation protein A [candidate division KSB1 bacterium]
MYASWLILISIAAMIIGYIWYGRFLTRHFDIDPKRATPSHTQSDGVDYVPAKPPVLLGHHFSSIAGAGPILGPIYAAIFGWIPVFLWILIGSIFVGGVHDFSSLVASVRHGGKSIGEVIEEHIGKAGKRLFLIFTWFMLTLVIAVFCKAVASIFVKTPATATSSGLFIVLAILFGMSIYRLKAPLWIASIIGVLLLIGSVVLGVIFPITQSYNVWMAVLLVYIFIAAVTPVWILLQPRDYLNSFLLYFIMVGGLVGILVANPKITFPAITQFETDLGYLFPILFVTVACGAISGFHSLVSSGTTAKQLNLETDAKPVGYGSMLIEGVLAVVALITAVTILQSDYSRLVTKEGGGPIGIFSNGIGGFLTHLGLAKDVGVTFAALAISAFALTTLDTATRLGRFAFQEFFESGEKKSVLSKNRYIGTLVTIAFAGLLTFSGSGSTLWPLFGSANQLLASLVLLAVTVWLAELKKKNRFVKIPMIFMFCVTLAALVNLIADNITFYNFYYGIIIDDSAFMLSHFPIKSPAIVIIALLLLVVSVILVFEAGKSLKKLKLKN